jgi:hypothetical protein
LHDVPLFVEGSPYQLGCLGKCPFVETPPELATGPLPGTEYLREHSFSVGPRFEVESPELIDQYIEAYRKVTASVDELRKYQAEHTDEFGEVAVSGHSLNPV